MVEILISKSSQDMIFVVDLILFLMISSSNKGLVLSYKVDDWFLSELFFYEFLYMLHLYKILLLIY